MPIELTRETEALIRQDVRRGANRSAITAELEAGYASAERGDLIDEDEVRIRMAARKQRWLTLN